MSTALGHSFLAIFAHESDSTSIAVITRESCITFTHSFPCTSASSVTSVIATTRKFAILREKSGLAGVTGSARHPVKARTQGAVHAEPLPTASLVGATQDLSAKGNQV